MPGRRLLFIGYVWPEHRSSGAGVRTRALLEQALAGGFEVHFAAPSSETVFTEELRQLGVKTHPVQANDSAFDAWIRALSPAVAILDRFVLEEQFGWRIRENSPDTAIVIDLQDLHFLRRAREHQVLELKAVRPGKLVPESDPDLNRDDTYREIAAILRADLSLVISRAELELVLRMGIPKEKVLDLAYSYPAPESAGRTGSVPGFAERQNFVSLGNFRHPPNLDSVRLLVREIWPAIRARLPEAELHLYGAYPPKEISDLRVPGVRPMGSCADAIETLQRYRVLLAPLRFGAGLKGKVADSWMAGTAVCTTSIGAEGLYGGEVSGFPGIAVDDASEFIEAAVRLHQDEPLWGTLTKQALEEGLKLFSWETNGARFVTALEQLIGNLPSKRKLDYLQGSFLQQQAAASKYLSRWIEVKNAVKTGAGSRATESDR